MYFVVLGLLLIVLNLAGIGPMADWTWNLTGDLWKFALPFICAAIWWTWADASGYNKRREMEKMDAKRQARRESNLEALGMGSRVQHKKRKATERRS